MFNFWWSAALVDGLKPHPPPLSSQKNKMLVFGLHSTSDDQPGWSMDLNQIHHPSPAKKMKCLLLDYVQLLMIGWAGQWTRTLSTTPLQPKKLKCSFLDYVQLLVISRAGQCTRTASTTPLQPIKWNAHFWVMFWWSAGLVDGLKPHSPPSPAKNIKCPFLDYIQLLMIGRAARWTWTPSTTFVQPKNKFSFLDHVQLLMIGQAGWWTRTPSATPLQPKK